MSLKIDCGDVELSVNIVFGMTYRGVPANDDERKQRNAMMEKVMAMKPEFEASTMKEFADAIGYDAETIERKVTTRDVKFAEDREAEKQGRAEKSAQRAGLPKPTPPPSIVHGLDKPTEESKESA